MHPLYCSTDDGDGMDKQTMSDMCDRPIESVPGGKSPSSLRWERLDDGWYVRGWRPTFGYAVAFGWVATTGAVAWAVVHEPAQAPAIIAALMETAPLWGMALGVLGVAVVKRSQDKAQGNRGSVSRE